MSLYCLCVKCSGNEQDILCENDLLDAFIQANKPFINTNKIKNFFNINNISYILMITVILLLI